MSFRNGNGVAVVRPQGSILASTVVRSPGNFGTKSFYNREGVRMKRVLVALAATGVALSLIAPAGAQEPAVVTHVCTEFGTALLPPGPPPRSGQLTVIVDGQTITTRFVPGPCQAPGFVRVATG